MRRMVMGIAMVLAMATAARADGEHGLSGFVMQHAGDLKGRVTDVHGEALADVKVHLVLKGGKTKTVRTDKTGRYKAHLESGALVYVDEEARIEGQAAVSAKDNGGEESVEIHDVTPMKSLAKNLGDSFAIPPYTHEAEDRNDWRRAWLLLDIDSTGTVQHIQLLNAPGLGLDEIAIREGFKLRFEPAHDLADRPAPSLMVYSFEWPSFWWLNKHPRRDTVPGDARDLPCRNSGPFNGNTVFRDCSEPDLTKAATQAWIPRPK